MKIVQYHANHNEWHGRLPIINQWIGLREKLPEPPPIIHWKIYDYNWYFGPQLQSMGYIMIYSLFYQHI